MYVYYNLFLELKNIKKESKEKMIKELIYASGVLLWLLMPL